MSSMYRNHDYRNMKKFVEDAYDTPTWKWKVAHMKPGQIIAIYFNLKKPKKIKKSDGQLSLFDIFPEAMATGGTK